VKTIVQNTEGDEISSIQVVREIYESGGIGAFFDGLTPKMLRAAVNHAVTFWVYDLVHGAITGAITV
jgi:Mitochondrial carrier protein